MRTTVLTTYFWPSCQPNFKELNAKHFYACDCTYGIKIPIRKKYRKAKKNKNCINL